MFSKSHSFLDGVAVPDLFNRPVNDTGVLGSNPRPSSELWLPRKLTSLTITGFPLSKIRREKKHYLFVCQLQMLSSADNLGKQFGSRSGQRKCLIVFLKEFFEKANFEKRQQTTTKAGKFIQKVKS